MHKWELIRYQTIGCGACVYRIGKITKFKTKKELNKYIDKYLYDIEISEDIDKCEVINESDDCYVNGGCNGKCCRFYQIVKKELNNEEIKNGK